jgi:hypothetical protein
VREAWLRCRHTGYGEAVRLIARPIYGIEEIAELTPAQLGAAQARNRELRRPGERLRLLRDVANLAHGQRVFAFGGDTGWPSSAVAYAHQGRTWLTRTLQAEVDDGLLTERDAIAYATRLMRLNQLDCFNIVGRPRALLAANDAAAAP